MGKQDRTNPSNYDYPDKYQVHSSERNQNFVQEKMIGNMGHICRVTLGILERLKRVIAHLTTTVVLNCQIVFQPGSAGRGLHLPTWGYRPLQASRPNQLATLPSIWHYSGLQLAQNWHQNFRDLRRNVTQYYDCMMHVFAKIKSSMRLDMQGCILRRVCTSGGGLGEVLKATRNQLHCSDQIPSPLWV